MVRADATLGRAIHKAGRRLLPFLLLLYVVAFLDRVNIGYVKQPFLQDTGMTELAFARGAGIFFLGYALLEIPSNLILSRLGARIWLARIMITWGIVAAAMMFAWTPARFYFLRVLLGMMEAGFFPGVILYLAWWFPETNRGKMIGLFYFGAPCAQIFGGPLSGLLLNLDGIGGFKGWQWVFLAEGLLAVGLGLAALNTLTDRPARAHWLSKEERTSLQTAMDAEEQAKPSHTHTGILGVLARPRIWSLGLVYGLIQLSVYGVTFYLPFQVGRLLHLKAGFVVGAVSAIPWACALLAAYAVPRAAGHPGRKRAVATLCLALAAAGIAFSSSANPFVGLAALCVATAGFIGVQPVFWTLPTGELSGKDAACGIALFNSIGSIGGFWGPNLRAMAERIWVSPSAGTTLLAAATLGGAMLLFRAIGRSQRSET